MSKKESRREIGNAWEVTCGWGREENIGEREKEGQTEQHKEAEIESEAGTWVSVTFHLFSSPSLPFLFPGWVWQPGIYKPCARLQ